MDFRNTHFCKLISLIVLFIFCWTFVGGANMAYAFKSGLKNNNPSTLKNEKSVESKLSDIIKSVHDTLEDDSLDIKSKKDKLKAHKIDLIRYDTKMRQKFNETEKHLKDKAVSGAVLSRHKAFAKHYDNNYQQLSDSIDSLVADIPSSEFEKKRKATLEHLKKVKPPKKHVPLDPTKLPHRAAKEKKAKTETRVPPKPMKPTPHTELHPLVKDSPYASLYEPFEGYPPTQEAPILIASNGSLSGLTAGSISQGTPPSSEDLAETIDVQFTSAIMAKAAELANTPQAQSGALPIAIYEWVRNNVEYVPTWGSIQGAHHCLQTMKCNSFDTASLLIALFRANGIHARYLTLTGEIPIQKFMNSMGGFTDAQAALDFAATGGMPVTGLVESGKIKYVRFEQVIVEGWVDMIPSMGAKHRQGDTWIRFDPSMKGYTYVDGVNLAQEVPYDIDALAQSILSTVETDAFGNVVSVDLSAVDRALKTQRSAELSHINNNYADTSLNDFLGAKRIMKHEFPVLMGTLAYKTKTVHSRYREIPDSLRHKIAFSVAPTESNYYVEPFSITKTLSEVAGKRINVGYFPATQEDLSILTSYVADYDSSVPINPSLLSSAFPAYLLQVKPALMIDDVVIAQGGAIGLGMSESFTMTFKSPTRSDDNVKNIITSGEQLGITIIASGISESAMERVKAEVGESANKVGSLLSATSLIYSYELGLADNHYSHTIDVNNVTFPSEAIFKQKVRAEMSFGVPVSISSNELIMDVDRYLSMVKAKDGNNEKKLQFMYASGTASSVLEHQVPEYIYSTEIETVTGVSAVRAIEHAGAAGISILMLDSSNINNYIAESTIDEYVKGEIRNAVNQGKYVLAPMGNVTIEDWTGIGYIALDPDTGSGAYMISDGYGGAVIFAKIMQSFDMYVQGIKQMPTGQKAFRLTQDVVFYPTIGQSTTLGIALYYMTVMTIKNEIGMDKYYHCKAFCTSTKLVGPLSSFTLSVCRELYNEFEGLWKNDSKYDMKDMEANILGITTPYNQNCDDSCSLLKP